jgi:Icc-related predicted phosphoesterase
MILQVVSDLHIGSNPDFRISVSPQADALIVAGDVCEKIEKAFEYLEAAVPVTVPTIFVAGNHEFWRGVHGEQVVLARELSRRTGIFFLENDLVELNGVRFCGSTTWTDYSLFGPRWTEAAMRSAYASMNDHKLIKWSKQPWLRFRPTEARKLHAMARDFFERQSIGDGKALVCISHHACTPESLAPEFRTEVSSAAYASDMSDLIQKLRPHLWIHGHVHRRCDYRIGATRVICNPVGYRGESTGFEPQLLVEV